MPTSPQPEPSLVEILLTEARDMFFGWIDAVLGWIEPDG